MTQMHWEQLLSPRRLHDQRSTSTREIGRSPFHKDHDRIVFSGSFRRLGRKTQVHPLTENDHIHTRLTHSLEVGCVGRSLGMIVGELLRDRLPEWITPADLGVIVQTACLGHDIGNPPFGHAGEYAIRDWFQRAQSSGLLEGLSDAEREDLLTYEGNAQGFRVITQIEYNQFNGGMRLSAATLGALLKYPWTVRYSGRAGKFGAYQSEQALLKEVAEAVGLLPQGEQRWCRHPLVYLVEAADDICYGLIDLEDGVEVGLLQYHEVETLLSPLLVDQWEQVQEDLANEEGDRRKLQILRGYAMEVMVQAVSASFTRHEAQLLQGCLDGGIIDYCPEAVRHVVADAKELARQRIFRDGRKLTIEIGSYTTLGILLDAFLSAARECSTSQAPTFRNARLLELMGGSAPQPGWTLYESYMRTIDYISGMTDTYAASLARQFSGYYPPTQG